MPPSPDPPASPTNAYEDFWAGVDADPGSTPPAVVPHAPTPATDAYAEFADLIEGEYGGNSVDGRPLLRAPCEAPPATEAPPLADARVAPGLRLPKRLS